MLVLITCQSCATSLTVDTEAGHVKVKCPKCGSIVSVPQAANSGTTMPDRPYAPKPEESASEPGPLFEYAQEGKGPAGGQPASTGEPAPEITPALFEASNGAAPAAPAGQERKLFEYSDDTSTPSAPTPAKATAGTAGTDSKPTASAFEYADSTPQGGAGTAAGPVSLSASDIQPLALSVKAKKKSSWRKEVTPDLVKSTVSVAVVGVALGLACFGYKLAVAERGFTIADKAPELLAITVNLLLIVILLGKSGGAFETLTKMLWLGIAVAALGIVIMAWKSITGDRKLVEVVALGLYVGILVCFAITAGKVSTRYDYDTYFGK